MSIKSDKWIQKMAAEHGMIEPFEAGQVREADGKKLISYGTSSYGYDVRCSDEFKVFTNVYSSIVDPKNFDPKSFVDIKADHIIIPPNSFCLARTVEYFRIPRNVLTVCLGKSTYARCFSADTKVALSNGRSLALEEMAELFARGEQFLGYSFDSNNNQVISQLEYPRFIGQDSLLEITLDNGKTVRCTPDHKIKKWGGQMVEADVLRKGDLLAGFHQSKSLPLKKEINKTVLGFNGFHLIKTASIQNVERLLNDCRKVIDIKQLKGIHAVYCLTVPKYGNFALEAGIFVANCGIIVNVTPFEPEWEGYVTLEFSNTTTLPAKIYANEGVAQVLFFEADDDDVCEISYKDRGGKYQRQHGVTIPRM
jgi:deoxycytidine triphosphate deaminase